MTANLTKSNNKVFAGVAAGIAEYINIDPVWVRLGIALAGLSAPIMTIIIYLILMYIMPDPDGKAEAMANTFSDEEIIIKDSFKANA